MNKQITVPKKKEQSKYAAIACEALKGSLKGKELFKIVHGREGSASEVQTFINRLNANRSNPGADIIGQMVEKIPSLQGLTMAEFFKIKN